jgi:predicted nuclease with TOPRIM domain
MEKSNKKINELEKINKGLQEMLDLQIKLVTELELEIANLKKQIASTKKDLVNSQEKELTRKLENEDLRSMVFVLTKNKKPCKPDHNGECLICDCPVAACPLTQQQQQPPQQH